LNNKIEDTVKKPSKSVYISIKVVIGYERLALKVVVLLS